MAENATVNVAEERRHIFCHLVITSGPDTGLTLAHRITLPFATSGIVNSPCGGGHFFTFGHRRKSRLELTPTLEVGSFSDLVKAIDER